MVESSSLEVFKRRLGVELRLECCAQCLAPGYKETWDVLETLPRRTREITAGLEHLSCEESVRELELFSLEKKRLRQISHGIFHFSSRWSTNSLRETAKSRRKIMKCG